MNFLAHCLIAARVSNDTETGVVAGAVLGDFVKGQLPPDWPSDLTAGVRLHRRIDAFSNSEPSIRDSCQRFPTEIRRFAPIFVDIAADYILAQQWQTLGEGQIHAFANRCYDTLDAHAAATPARGRRFVDYMRTSGLLSRYDDPRTIQRAMDAIGERLNRPDLGPRAFEHMQSDLPALAEDFARYWPALLAEAAAFRSSHPTIAG